MTIKLVEHSKYEGTERGGIGANSTDTSATDFFVSKTGNVVSKAGASGEVVGVSLTRKVYTSDNQTVAAAELNFIPALEDNLYDVTITNGTITVDDEQKYFNLTSAGNIVDGTTESTTTGQLQMIKFKSATLSTFRIANK